MSDRLTLFALAARQHGSVSVPQLYAMGATPETIRQLVASGQWIRVTPMVLRRAGSPPSRGQRALEAVLDAGAGAALSHESDAAWWRLNGFTLGRGLQVMRLRNSTSTPARLAAVIHEPRLFPAQHRTVLDGVPVVVPSRIPFDLANSRPWMAEKALDRGWARGVLSYRSSMQMLRELSERGRKGITLMRELLAARGPGYRPNDTNLEDRFCRLGTEAGIFGLERQENICDREWLGRIDLLWAIRMIIFEIDSALYHGALIDQAADAARDAALRAAGYRIERFTDTQVWFDPAGTVRRLRAIASGS